MVARDTKAINPMRERRGGQEVEERNKKVTIFPFGVPVSGAYNALWYK